jgi:cation diffusion facilitator family transporter
MTTDRTHAGNRAINTGLSANIFLALLKTAVGILGHSEALLADGINSTSDVAYGVVVKVFMLFAGRPPDREHPYGHRQLESIAALTVGSFVVATAIALFWDAGNKVYDILQGGAANGPVGLIALWVSLLTIAAKLVLAGYTQRVAAQTGNAAILALARDHRNDIFSAAGAAVGIMISRLGYDWGDPLVGAIVAMVVLLTGIQILRDASADLMDAVPGEEIDRQARAALKLLPGVKAVEEVLAHRFGPYLVLNVTICVDGGASVAEGDRIASEVERSLCAEFALVRRVYVHYHPLRAGE